MVRSGEVTDHQTRGGESWRVVDRTRKRRVVPGKTTAALCVGSDGSVRTGGACRVMCRDHDLFAAWVAERAGGARADTRNVVEAVLRDLVLEAPFAVGTGQIGVKVC